MTDLVPVRRALISLSDKAGLDALAAGLERHGVEIVSTGGTAAKLRELGAEVRDISDLTGFPEMMDGRVKTLHPKVHGGLLGGARQSRACRGDGRARHRADRPRRGQSLSVPRNDVTKGADRDTIIENIDIGGPSMVRSAAKNHAHVAIVTDPADYAELLAELDANGGDQPRLPQAARGQGVRAAPRPMIRRSRNGSRSPTRASASPPAGPMSSTLKMPLRYGENPHQQAALYLPVGPHARGIAQAEQVQGKELSYNNLNDASAALELVAEFRDGDPAVVIVKHANPCGVAQRRHAASTRGTRRSPATASRRSAGSSPPTARSTRATAEAIAADLHRSRGRARRRRRRPRDLREEEEPAPAADRRAARSGARRPDAGGDRRRPAGPGPRQWPCHARPAASASPSASRPSRNWPTACSPGPSPSTSSRTPSSMPRTASPPGIGAGQMNRRDSARIAAIKAQRSGRGQWLARAAHGRLGGRVGRLLPLRRRPARGGRSRRDCGHPAGRLDPRRRSDRRRRRSRAWRCCSPGCATSATEAAARRCRRCDLVAGFGCAQARRSRPCAAEQFAVLGAEALGPQHRAERGQDRRDADDQLQPIRAAGRPSCPTTSCRRRRPDQGPAPARHRRAELPAQQPRLDDRGEGRARRTARSPARSPGQRSAAGPSPPRIDQDQRRRRAPPRARASPG